MMRNCMFALALPFFIQAGCQNLKEDKVSEQHDQEKAMIAVLAGADIDNDTNAGATCVTTASSPAFATLAAAGVTSNCDSCHGGAAPKAGLVTSDYNSMVSEVVKGDPANSELYQKITTGSMKDNSNATINQAVYDWIAGCAAP